MMRTSSIRWLAALVLPFLAAVSVQAQTWGYPVVYPVYGPWGVVYVPSYYPYLPTVAAPGRQAATLAQTSRASAPAYAAPPSDSEERPSYYSEDYAGPEGPTSEPSKVAYIRVRVPANAELWINKEKRTQKGTVREFETPALDPDRVYVYHIKARWTEDGGIEVQKTLRVRTIAGTRVTVNFVRPPASQPRLAVPTPVAAVSPPRIEQRPIDWTSGNVAPRSFRGGSAPGP